ncbi:hypothetical protein VCSRO147_3527 [Vibrio cholerae]|nr:putative O-antigen polymerase [Vibrio cholerae]GIC34067.1 hypothetical protein VCSRO147_3527 [Vibrio cholerae]
MNNTLHLNKEKLNSFFIKFMVIDLLFFPNFLFSTPLCFFLLPCVLIFNNRLRASILCVFIVIFIFMLASVINGSVEHSNTEVENLKRVLQFLLIASLFLYKNAAFNFHSVVGFLNKLVCIFIIYLCILLFFFFFNESLYLTLMLYLSPMVILQIEENVNINRFSYYFSDPNSLGYLLSFISVYVLFHFRKPNFKIFVFTLIFVMVLFTQSRGALISMLLVTVAYFFYKLDFSIKSIRFFVFISVFLISIAFILQDYIVLVNDAFKARSEIEAAMGTGLGGGRDVKYKYLIDNFNFKFFGVGYSLFIDSKEFKPHSDFIRMILSYGVFSLIPLCLFLFPSNFRSFVLLLAFSVPFMINTVIDDYRLFGIFIIFFIIIERYNKQLSFPCKDVSSEYGFYRSV